MQSADEHPDLDGVLVQRVGAAADLAETVARAVKTPGPSLVEVDMAAIGAFPPYAPYNTLGIYARRAAE